MHSPFPGYFVIRVTLGANCSLSLEALFADSRLPQNPACATSFSGKSKAQRLPRVGDGVALPFAVRAPAIAT